MVTAVAVGDDLLEVTNTLLSACTGRRGFKAEAMWPRFLFCLNGLETVASSVGFYKIDQIFHMVTLISNE